MYVLIVGVDRDVIVEHDLDGNADVGTRVNVCVHADVDVVEV